MADFAQAARAVVVIVNGSARSRVKRRHVIDKEPVMEVSAWQFQRDVPEAIDAFVHVMRRRRAAFGQTNNQQHRVRFRSAEAEDSGLGEDPALSVIWLHGSKN